MIFLGADHGGFELKEMVSEWLSEWGHDFQDLGAFEYDKEDDYPVFAFRVAEEVAKNPDTDKGILLCRSGAGVCIAANKVKGVRAVSVTREKEALHAREHNNANVIALSGDWLDEVEAKDILKTFLETEFSGEERHFRRLSLITKYEQER